MASLKNIDLVVRDIRHAVAFFRDVVGLSVLQEFERFAELDGVPIKLLLSPDALVPISYAGGIILHFEEPDTASAVRRATAFGAPVLRGPLQTDWGTNSVLVQGPEGVIVDFYRLTQAVL